METMINIDNKNKIYKVFKKLGCTMEDTIEDIVEPNLSEKFGKLGLEFNRIAKNMTFLEDNHVFVGTGFFCENEESVLVIELQTELTHEIINYHIEHMEKLRIWADKRKDKRKYIGAIGAMVMSDSERNYALKQGFYLITPSGETFDITVPPGKNFPKVW